MTTFHRIDNRVVRLVDGLSHIVLGYQDMGQYLRWCGGYMAPERFPTDGFKLPGEAAMLTCFFCLHQVKAR